MRRSRSNSSIHVQESSSYTAPITIPSSFGESSYQQAFDNHASPSGSATSTHQGSPRPSAFLSASDNLIAQRKAVNVLEEKRSLLFSILHFLLKHSLPREISNPLIRPEYLAFCIHVYDQIADLTAEELPIFYFFIMKMINLAIKDNKIVKNSDGFSIVLSTQEPLPFKDLEEIITIFGIAHQSVNDVINHDSSIKCSIYVEDEVNDLEAIIASNISYFKSNSDFSLIKFILNNDADSFIDECNQSSLEVDEPMSIFIRGVLREKNQEIADKILDYFSVKRKEAKEKSDGHNETLVRNPFFKKDKSVEGVENYVETIEFEKKVAGIISQISKPPRAMKPPKPISLSSTTSSEPQLSSAPTTSRQRRSTRQMRQTEQHKPFVTSLSHSLLLDAIMSHLLKSSIFNSGVTLIKNEDLNLFIWLYCYTHNMGEATARALDFFMIDAAIYAIIRDENYLKIDSKSKPKIGTNFIILFNELVRRCGFLKKSTSKEIAPLIKEDTAFSLMEDRLFMAEVNKIKSIELSLDRKLLIEYMLKVNKNDFKRLLGRMHIDNVRPLSKFINDVLKQCEPTLSAFCMAKVNELDNTAGPHQMKAYALITISSEEMPVIVDEVQMQSPRPTQTGDDSELTSTVSSIPSVDLPTPPSKAASLALLSFFQSGQPHVGPSPLRASSTSSSPRDMEISPRPLDTPRSLSASPRDTKTPIHSPSASPRDTKTSPLTLSVSSGDMDISPRSPFVSPSPSPREQAETENNDRHKLITVLTVHLPLSLMYTPVTSRGESDSADVVVESIHGLG